MNSSQHKVTCPDVVVLFEEAKALYPNLASALVAIEENHPLSSVDSTTARLKELRELLHARQHDDVPTALCLSGGGIRSATFSLGVIQGLASRGLLSTFHYMSTVSGGGYIGSWLSAWIRNEALRLKAPDDDLARLQKSGTSEKEPQPIDLKTYNAARDHVFKQLGQVGNGQIQEPTPLRKLRAFSNFLSPMRGISADAMTLLAIYARNLALNWMVLIPCLVVTLLLPRLHLAIMHDVGVQGYPAIAMAFVAWFLIAWTIAYMASDLPAAPGSDLPEGTRLEQRAPKRPPSVTWSLVLPLLTSAVLISWLIAWHVKGHNPLSSMSGLFKPDNASSFYRLLQSVHWPESMRLFDVDGVYALVLTSIVGGLTHGMSSVIGGTLLRRFRAQESGNRPASLSAGIAVICVGGLTGTGLYALLLGLIRLSSSTAGQDLRLLALLGVPALLLVFWFGVTIYAGWRRPEGHEDEREWWARAAARWLGPSIAWLLAFGLVLYLPGSLLSWSGLKDESASAALGASTGMLGVIVALMGYLSKHGPAWRQRAESFVEKTGMRMLDLVAIVFIVLFLSSINYGIAWAMRGSTELRQRQDAQLSEKIFEPAEDKAMCVALQAAGKSPLFPVGSACNPKPCAGESCGNWSDKARHRYEKSLVTIPPSTLFGWIIGLLALALLISWRIGVNAFSLHNLYGNRLVRAYLAASRLAAERRPHWFTGFDPKDNVPMGELWPQRPSQMESAPKLLHIVNIALNLVAPSGARLEWQDRKAAPFTMSPLFSGSEVTDYVWSDAYIASPHRQGVSLGCAMTISGAAAAPNMGYHSSAPLAFVMTLFNIRLGLWMPNPSWPRRSGHGGVWPWRRDEPIFGLNALLDEARGNTSEETRFLSLSDGGHFDNMGLYEMVRRRCRRIVLVDATADPEYAFDDLLSTLRKIRIDMGIEIDFPAGLPGPSEKRRSGRAVAVGIIRYEQADIGANGGEIVLIKPTLLPDPPHGPRLPLDVRHYASETAKDKAHFPQQSTSDQFFDEAQFESYRMLGLHTTLAAFGPGNLSPTDPSTPIVLAGGGEVMATTNEEMVDKDAPTDATRGMPAAGLLDQIRDSIGLIAATAVVSAVTVTGAVHLTDAKVKLEDAQVRIVNPEVTLVPPLPSPSASGVPGTVSIPGVDTAPFEDSMRRLVKAAEAGASATNGFADRAERSASAVSGLAVKASDAGTEVDVFKGKLAGNLSKINTGSVEVHLSKDTIQALQTTASAAALAASRAESAASAAQQATAKIVDMNTYLQQIRDNVAQTPPRSNARGAGEGGQR